MKRSGGGRIFIILGFLLAFISGIGVFYLLATAEPQAVPVQTSKLVVSFQQIPGRSEISPDQIGQVEWPQTVPTPLGAFAEPTEVVGKIARNPIFPGQTINSDMVISKDDAEAQHSNAALIIEKGQVAIAIGVGLDSSVAEALQAGDRVDLIVTYNVELQNPLAGRNNAQYSMSQKTLENVLILQVGPWPREIGEQSSQGGGPVNALTLQMTEQDAVALRHIQNTASDYAFVLRAANDEQIFTTEPVTIEYLNKRFNFQIPGLGQ
ncbi:Flp pilus assembly protein CpaB [Anaerolineae bacterium CFX7]|nr:Flp pilus assembly protein CpaB [Anaerolineae bacterium CFX7]